MNYNDLKNKTIFNFTKDEKILKKIFPEDLFEEFLENPDKIIEESKEWQDSAKLSDIVEFAKITDNTELYFVLEKNFRDLYPIYFWKPGELWPN
jgi:hypothetical protein